MKFLKITKAIGIWAELQTTIMGGGGAHGGWYGFGIRTKGWEFSISGVEESGG